MTLTSVFSDGGTPAAPAPWMTALFEDAGANTVKLTLTSTSSPLLLAGTKFNILYFNSTVAITGVTQAAGAAGGTSPETYDGFVAADHFKPNAIKPDGGHAGLFDLQLNFDNDPWGLGTTNILTLTGTGLTAESFNSPSVADGAKPGGYTFAAHMQAYNSAGQSTWLRGNPSTGTPPPLVPLPAAAWSGMALLAGLGIVAKLRKRKD
jgi:hypothetical protein